MESQLQTLIDKIKNDGVAEADKQAQQIVSLAEQKAAGIVRNAKAQAEEIVRLAQRDASRTEEAGKKALEQAGRNLILGLQKRITDLFDQVLKQETGAALTPEAMGGIIEKLLENWTPGKAAEIQLSSQDAGIMTQSIIKKLQKKAKNGVELKPVDSVDSGFRIGEKNGNVFYDFTDRGIAETLAQYLNPKLAEILQKGES